MFGVFPALFKFIYSISGLQREYVGVCCMCSRCKTKCVCVFGSWCIYSLCSSLALCLILCSPIDVLWMHLCGLSKTVGLFFLSVTRIEYKNKVIQLHRQVIYGGIKLQKLNDQS